MLLSMSGLPLLDKEGSGTPVFKIKILVINESSTQLIFDQNL